MNFQRKNNRLGYAQVKLNLVVNPADTDAIKFHQPLLRDAAVELLCEHQKMNYRASLQEIRTDLTQRFNSILFPETRKMLIKDVLITKWLVR